MICVSVNRFCFIVKSPSRDDDRKFYSKTPLNCGGITTNSAIWAWILSALKQPDEGNPRYKIAKNIFDIAEIPLPEPDAITEIQTEQTFKSLQRTEGHTDKLKKRLDVFFRYISPTPSVFFIENKVADKADKNDIEGIYNQIAPYYAQFLQIRQVAPDYCLNVYPAYFGYEDFVCSELKKYTQKHYPELAHNLITFSVHEMMQAFEGSDFSEDLVLQQFYDWLRVKKEFVRIRRKARLKDNADTTEVIHAARPLGFGELLELFMKRYDEIDLLNGYISQISVDIRNINFRNGNATPLSIRWFYNSGFNGLYIGIHKNIRELVNKDLFENIPHDYACEQDRQWLFGYLKNVQDVERFFS